MRKRRPPILVLVDGSIGGYHAPSAARRLERLGLSANGVWTSLKLAGPVSCTEIVEGECSNIE